MTTINTHTTRSTGTVLTSAIYNGDHEVHVGNANSLNDNKLEIPASLTDNALIKLDGVAGLTQETGIIVSDNDDLSGIRNISLTGTVDGRDIAADGTKLDGIESGATAETTATESAEGLLEKATDSEIRAATSGAKAICAEDLNSAATPQALSDAATVAVDWTAGINFTLTITANRTLGNPTNEIPGTIRTVLVEGNDGTARTLSFGSEYGGSVPTLDDITSTKKYLLTIYCKSAGQFLVTSIDGSDA